MSAGGTISLADAMQNVAHLATQSLPDDQPQLQALAESLAFDISFDTNFQDRGAFMLGVSKHVEEAQDLAYLNVTIEQGMEFAHLLYTWRSCSRAIPQVARDGTDQERSVIYRKTVEIMDRHIEKLYSFYRFQLTAVKQFSAEIAGLAHPERRKDYFSESRKLTIARMLDMFAILDSIKGMKACIKNDFTIYKRARSFLQSDYATDQIQLQQDVGLFLANQNSVLVMLRDAVVAIEGYEGILADVAIECLSVVETNRYLLPRDKYSRIRAISFALYLIDFQTGKGNLTKTKALNLTKFDELFSNYPVVPLMGDVQFQPHKYLEMTPNYDSSKWLAAKVSQTDRSRWDVESSARLFGSQFNECVAKLRLFELESVQQDVAGQAGRQSKACKIALEGLQLLSSWSCFLQELVVRKLANPAESFTLPESAADAEAYERATKFNYTSKEKTAMIEIISYIKGLHRLLRTSSKALSSRIRHEIHQTTQFFVQDTLREPIRQATKRKKHKTRSVLVAIVATCADWIGGKAPDDPCMRGTKSDIHYDIPNRRVGLGSTQSYMLKTMLGSLLDDKRSTFKADIDTKSWHQVAEFAAASHFFDALLNFEAVADAAADLSQLWFREFFLEMTMGKRVQFPIEMSLPWILIDHALKDNAMLEHALLPFELYNDSADYALSVMKQQFLFDEIQAEVDLCFDQFAYKLGESVFLHAKQCASFEMLAKTKKNLPKLQELHPGPNRFSSIIQQRHMQILGRSIDICKLLQQRLNFVFKQNVHAIIGRFEANDLCHVLELENAIDNAKLAHKILSSFVDLDSFEEIFNEANESVTSPYGRIVLHVFAELCFDILPSFAYDDVMQRFVKSKNAPTFVDAPSREAAPKMIPDHRFGSKAFNSVFAQKLKPYEAFFGMAQIHCIVRMLGYSGFWMCIDQIIKYMTSNIRNVLTPYVKSILTNMPKHLLPPSLDESASEIFSYYQHGLNDIVSFRDLQTEVFHAFREIGNSLIIIMLMEEAIKVEEVGDLVCGYPFQGRIPVRVQEGDDPKKIAEEVRANHAYMLYGDVIKSEGPPVLRDQVDLGQALTRERLCLGLDVFGAVLDRIKDILVDIDKTTKVWGADKRAHTSSSLQFHNVWSVIQYTLVLSTSAGAHFAKQYFGDGIVWAGCTFLRLLEQHHKFEAVDYCYQVLEAYREDSSGEGSTSSQAVQSFVAAVSKHRKRMQMVLSLLDQYVTRPKASRRATAKSASSN